MAETWDQARIQRLIDDQVQESLKMEFKAAGALDRTDKKKTEITKDVSAMANSAGGTIIYGITEKNHLPERIDPVDRTQFSHEWLEHVINNIQPRIDGLVIHPVQIDTGPSDTVHVVEIPQSTTAHQAMDKRYYKRFNFESVPMDDYEIRDVMGRQKHPKIELAFVVEARISKIDHSSIEHYLTVTATNRGQVYASYFCVELWVSLGFLSERQAGSRETIDIDGITFAKYTKDNTILDRASNPVGFKPLLPDLSFGWEIKLNPQVNRISIAGEKIRWSVHADNAPLSMGEIEGGHINCVDRRQPAQ